MDENSCSSGNTKISEEMPLTKRASGFNGLMQYYIKQSCDNTGNQSNEYTTFYRKHYLYYSSPGIFSILIVISIFKNRL